MKLFAAAMPLFLLTGCYTVHVDSYTVYISPDLTPAHAIEVMHGMDSWQEMSAGMITFTPVVSDHQCVMTGEICVRPVTYDLGNGKVGYTDRSAEDASNIVLDESVPDEEFHPLVRHELGHALGLNHTGPGTVMCGDYYCGSKDVTCADAQYAMSLRGIRHFCGG